MSSKKALRKKQKERAKQKRKGMDPATLFLLIVAAGIVLLGVGAIVFGGGGSDGPGNPPRPDAVWSPEHGHWH